MVDINQIFGGNSLKAADLKGREHNVVISEVTEKKFEDGNKLIISFQHRTKTLVCNKTNAERIAYVYGTNTDLWVGKEIQLYPDLVSYQGRQVDAIRVRPAPARGFSNAQQTAGAAVQPAAQPASSTENRGAFDDEIPF